MVSHGGLARWSRTVVSTKVVLEGELREDSDDCECS